MNKLARTKEIPLVCLPVTSSNRHNAKNHPAIDLRRCTPFQTLSYAGVRQGTVCLIGEPSRGIGIAKAMHRRSRKPFLLLDTAADRCALSQSLEPDWTEDTPQRNLPTGNGALLLSRPNAQYLDLCAYLEEWSQEYFLILHLGSGLQVGAEVLNLLNAIPECLVFCDSVPQSIRKNESSAISCKTFLENMNCIYLFSWAGAAREIVDLLPTYKYEKLSNTTSYNNFRSRTVGQPFLEHHGSGMTFSQSRTMDFKKSLYEQDDLLHLFDAGITVILNTQANMVYLSRVV